MTWPQSLLTPCPNWDEAYHWLCQQRKAAPVNACVWDLRWRWPKIRISFYQTVISGHWRLAPMSIQGRGQDAQVMWSAWDALVLKWVALCIQPQLPVHEACEHVKGRGVRMSVSGVAKALDDGQYRFVHRTDIRGYYEHILKHQVINQVNQFVADPVHRALIEQYVHYRVEQGGNIHTPTKGIPRGCALSPLIGASLLRHIDGWFRTFDPEEVYYVRYMDDFLLLTRTRWQLRRGLSQAEAERRVQAYVKRWSHWADSMLRAARY